MTDRFRIPGTAFATLAAGCSDASTRRLLRAAEMSKHALLLRYIADNRRSEMDTALAVLDAVQRRAYEPVAATLGSPFVGAWAAGCTRRIRAGTLAGADLAHLGAIAATAALRAGLDATVPTAVSRGQVTLPAVGGVDFDEPDGTLAQIEVQDGRATIATARRTVVAGAPDDGWRAVRRLAAESADLRLAVYLEDVDPYRACYRMEVAGRTPEEQVRRWEKLLDEAWTLLARYAPDYAAELATELHSIVPITGAHAGPGLSATARDAYGALALTMPDEAALLAVTLVHEYQHSKLSALLDLVPLYDVDATERYFAPWRPDPRPIGGLLQGAYAFLGVSAVWSGLRHCPEEREVAEREFAKVREQVRVVIETLLSCGRLTALGERFVAGMSASLDTLLAERLPPAAVAAAREALVRCEAEWRTRNS